MNIERGRLRSIRERENGSQCRVIHRGEEKRESDEREREKTNLLVDLGDVVLEFILSGHC